MARLGAHRQRLLVLEVVERLMVQVGVVLNGQPLSNVQPNSTALVLLVLRKARHHPARGFCVRMVAHQTAAGCVTVQLTHRMSWLALNRLPLSVRKVRALKAAEHRKEAGHRRSAQHG